MYTHTHIVRLPAPGPPIPPSFLLQQTQQTPCAIAESQPLKLCGNSCPLTYPRVVVLWFHFRLRLPRFCFFFFFKSLVTPMVFYVFQFLFFSSTKPLHGAAHPFWTPFLPQPTQRLSAAFATLREPPSCQKVSPWPSAHPTSPLTQASWRQAPGVPPSSGLRGASFCPCGATGLSLWPSPFQLHSWRSYACRGPSTTSGDILSHPGAML